MAEFAQTMKDWKRMCKSMVQEDEYTGCDKCDLRSFGCPAIYEKECDDANWNHIESVVTKWSAEHPEPVYPTWVEWFRKMGVAPSEQKCFHDWLLKPISADIAQKLVGIETSSEQGIKMTNWINVNDSLPEAYEDVLVYAEWESAGIDGVSKGEGVKIGWQVDGHWHIDGRCRVVAKYWMAIPELTKENQNERYE